MLSKLRREDAEEAQTNYLDKTKKAIEALAEHTEREMAEVRKLLKIRDFLVANRGKLR